MIVAMKEIGKMDISKVTVFSNGQMERYTRVYDISIQDITNVEKKMEKDNYNTLPQEDMLDPGRMARCMASEK